jgi:AcrR family transcriptional regulator
LSRRSEEFLLSTETTDIASLAPQRPQRADARRNYEKLLAAAHEEFAEEGTGATLEDVARRAEVGIGTLYRHFPTRQALQEAVYRDQIEALAAQAHDLAERLEPEDALVRWMRLMMAHAVVKRGLNRALMASCSRAAGRRSTRPVTCCSPGRGRREPYARTWKCRTCFRWSTGYPWPPSSRRTEPTA